ncbi:TolC family outer membrane protein [Duganella radicis]|uniref:TolC family outer membrane protein n=1 Tax=Duganella radicis TaxID=551988 RepID=A0A6L6PN40_9BURK|nr:TolC family outer membrane protein [Duganella radicis]MTV40548.1 TolC family outer membrane protein [Duganella radicis]
MLHSRAFRLTKTVLCRALCSALLLQGSAAGAMNLQQAYDAALRNDPTYRSAFQDSLGGKEYAVIGRAALLPQVSASYSGSKIRADLTQPGLLGTESTTHPVYYSRSSGVQLRQTLFSLDALARYKQGLAQTKYSESQFSSMGQDLVVRVAGAYFDAAQSAEQVALAEAQRDAQQEQLLANQRLFQQGEGTRTDVLETQARLELTKVQLIEAQDVQKTALAALSAMVGEPVEAIDLLGATFPLRPLEPSSLDEWKKIALEQNPDLDAQRFAIESNRQEINKNRAGHFPRVDFVAGYSKSKSDTLTTLNQDSTSRSIGVQVNIPLYAGGAVSASTRQAVAGFEKAKAELDVKTNKILVEVGKEFSLVKSSVARIAALDRAVESAQLLITATQQSIKGGVRINVDLLNARQQLYTSKRDLAQARYTYLLALLRLRAAAGTLGADDIVEALSYFR